jgi:uncharacterized protein (UPF0333 family)
MKKKENVGYLIQVLSSNEQFYYFYRRNQKCCYSRVSVFETVLTPQADAVLLKMAMTTGKFHIHLTKNVLILRGKIRKKHMMIE